MSSSRSSLSATSRASHPVSGATLDPPSPAFLPLRPPACLLRSFPPVRGPEFLARPPSTLDPPLLSPGLAPPSSLRVPALPDPASLHPARTFAASSGPPRGDPDPASASLPPLAKPWPVSPAGPPRDGPGAAPALLLLASTPRTPGSPRPRPPTGWRSVLPSTGPSALEPPSLRPRRPGPPLRAPLRAGPWPRPFRPPTGRLTPFLSSLDPPAPPGRLPTAASWPRPPSRHHPGSGPPRGLHPPGRPLAPPPLPSTGPPSPLPLPAFPPGLAPLCPPPRLGSTRLGTPLSRRSGSSFFTSTSNPLSRALRP